jgi:hypothetical protein
MKFRPNDDFTFRFFLKIDGGYIDKSTRDFLFGKHEHRDNPSWGYKTLYPKQYRQVYAVLDSDKKDTVFKMMDDNVDYHEIDAYVKDIMDEA